MKKYLITQKEYLILNLFVNQYNWKGIEFPSPSNNWKKFEQNNTTVAFNLLFVPYSTKQIRRAHISKYNHKRDNQIILLMITNDGNS